MLKRREFLKLTSLGAAGLTAGGCSCFDDLLQKILHRPVRKNIATLSPNDPILLALDAAVAAMKALRPSDPRNWANQANIHNNHCPHSNWLFLPWHRAYLYYFEEICRELSGMSDFALPYWNWSTSPQVPTPFWSGNLTDATR